MTQNLSESDARTITARITDALIGLGARVETIGVALDTEGFWFSGVINGHQVWVRRGQGNWDYLSVAADLLASALEGRLAQFEDRPTDGSAPLTATPIAG